MSSLSSRPARLFLCTVSALVALNLAVQNFNLGRAVIPGLDEGIYLYAAKLITQGSLPYRDFFLSHPPLLFAGAAAGLLIAHREYVPASVSVIDLAMQSNCTYYDCEFVAVARSLSITLVTQHRALLKAFPGDAMSLADALAGG